MSRGAGQGPIYTVVSGELQLLSTSFIKGTQILQFKANLEDLARFVGVSR